MSLDTNGTRSRFGSLELFFGSGLEQSLEPLVSAGFVRCRSNPTASTLACVLLAPAGERDEQRLLTGWQFPHPPRRLVAVHARHADVEEHHLRREFGARRLHESKVLQKGDT